MKPPDLQAVRERMMERRAQTTARAMGVLLKIHREVYVRSDGRFGAKELGVPSLLLTVTGRSTGNPQTVALIYATDGEDLVVVASNGGSDAHPSWFENLIAHPSVGVQVARTKFSATAEVIDQNDRRYPRLWTAVNVNNNGRYYHYQQATKRPIPLVVLHRSEPT
jgi:deazaflavin-dependent oxidoreductase (nitroreductase family)